MPSLSGKGVLVVGARRVGGRIVERLAEEGAHIAIGYLSSRAEAQALVDSVAGGSIRTHLVQGDLGVEADVLRMLDEAKHNLGDLSFIVNLASGFEHTPFDQLDAAAWERGLVAARGAYLLGVHGGRLLQQNPGPTRGHIIFFGDWAAGETPYPDYLPYLTGKAAIHFMTRAFAVELAPHGILVNAIAPGPTLRPPDISQESWDQDVVARTPLLRTSSGDDMAEFVVTLLKSQTVTGEILRIDAGRHIRGSA